MLYWIVLLTFQFFFFFFFCRRRNPSYKLKNIGHEIPLFSPNRNLTHLWWHSENIPLLHSTLLLPGLSDVQCVENQHVVVVLGQRHHIALRRYLEATAPTHFDVWALKLPDQWAITLKDGHMETVAVAVTYQDIASITDVNTVGVVGDVFAANATHELAILIEDNHTVTLLTYTETFWCPREEVQWLKPTQTWYKPSQRSI